MEAIILRLSGETIKFSSILKKKEDNQERALISEKKSEVLAYSTDILADKKLELEALRKKIYKVF